MQKMSNFYIRLLSFELVSDLTIDNVRLPVRLSICLSVTLGFRVISRERGSVGYCHSYGSPHIEMGQDEFCRTPL